MGSEIVFSASWALRAVDAEVVPVTCFARVTKSTAPEGPTTASIISGVTVLVRLTTA